MDKNSNQLDDLELKISDMTHNYSKSENSLFNDANSTTNLAEENQKNQNNYKKRKGITDFHDEILAIEQDSKDLVKDPYEETSNIYDEYPKKMNSKFNLNNDTEKLIEFPDENSTTKILKEQLDLNEDTHYKNNKLIENISSITELPSITNDEDLAPKLKKAKSSSSAYFNSKSIFVQLDQSTDDPRIDSKNPIKNINNNLRQSFATVLADVYFKFDGNSVGKPEKSSVFISGIPLLATCDDIEMLLKRFGHILDIQYPICPLLNKHLGIAQVTFGDGFMKTSKSSFAAISVVKNQETIFLGDSKLIIELDSFGNLFQESLKEALNSSKTNFESFLSFNEKLSMSSTLNSGNPHHDELFPAVDKTTNNCNSPTKIETNADYKSEQILIKIGVSQDQIDSANPIEDFDSIISKFDKPTNSIESINFNLESKGISECPSNDHLKGFNANLNTTTNHSGTSNCMLVEDFGNEKFTTNKATIGIEKNVNLFQSELDIKEEFTEQLSNTLENITKLIDINANAHHPTNYELNGIDLENNKEARFQKPINGENSELFETLRIVKSDNFLEESPLVLPDLQSFKPLKDENNLSTKLKKNSLPMDSTDPTVSTNNSQMDILFPDNRLSPGNIENSISSSPWKIKSFKMNSKTLFQPVESQSERFKSTRPTAAIESESNLEDKALPKNAVVSEYVTNNATYDGQIVKNMSDGVEHELTTTTYNAITLFDNHDDSNDTEGPGRDLVSIIKQSKVISNTPNNRYEKHNSIESYAEKNLEISEFKNTNRDEEGFISKPELLNISFFKSTIVAKQNSGSLDEGSATSTPKPNLISQKFDKITVQENTMPDISTEENTDSADLTKLYNQNGLSIQEYILENDYCLVIENKYLPFFLASENDLFDHFTSFSPIRVIKERMCWVVIFKTEDLAKTCSLSPVAKSFRGFHLLGKVQSLFAFKNPTVVMDVKPNLTPTPPIHHSLPSTGLPSFKKFTNAIRPNVNKITTVGELFSNVSNKRKPIGDTSAFNDGLSSSSEDDFTVKLLHAKEANKPSVNNHQLTKILSPGSPRTSKFSVKNFKTNFEKVAYSQSKIYSRHSSNSCFSDDGLFDYLSHDEKRTKSVNTGWEDKLYLFHEEIVLRQLDSSNSSYNLPTHSTGSARTEGYYILNDNLKNHRLKYEPLALKVQTISGIWKPYSASARIAQSHLDEGSSNIRLAQSGIHDWGLFTTKAITKGELVIQYVGELIRSNLADVRERNYLEKGIDSSYLFRVDDEYVVDATVKGNIARFINHSCMPNCYAKITRSEPKPRILIFAKHDIPINEEITYDYQFPIEEDNKIVCLCNTSACRGYLN